MSTERSRADAMVGRFFAYQEDCNRFDMEAAVRHFTEDGVIRFAGLTFAGPEGLFELHEYDRGCRALVYFSDVQAEGDTLSCQFIYETETDRVLGIPGLERRSTLTFRGELIGHWEIDDPSPEERSRRQVAMKPLVEWAEANHADLLERVQAGVNYDSGAAWTELALRWQRNKN